MEKRVHTLSEDTPLRKKRIIIGCSIAGTALIMAGTGIGIGYAIWHKKKVGGQDIISFNADYKPLMYWRDTQTITATSSLNKKVTLSSTFGGFNSNTGELKFENQNDVNTTITINADDGVAEQTINVYLSPDSPIYVIGKADGTDWAGYADGSFNEIWNYSISGSTITYEDFYGGKPGATPYTTSTGGEWKIPDHVRLNGFIYSVRIGYKAFINCYINEDVVLPRSNYVSIGDSAFTNMFSQISTVKVPECDYISIGDSAFQSCPELTEVILTGTTTATYIGWYAFQHAHKFTGFIGGTLNIGGTSKEAIGEQAFGQCPLKLNNLSNIIASNPEITRYSNDNDDFIYFAPTDFVISTEKMYGEGSGCLLAGNISSISNEWTSVSEDAFDGCAGLTSVDLSAASELNNNAFQVCLSLTSVICPATGFSVIGDFAFNHCPLLSSRIIIASSCKIGQYAFAVEGSEPYREASELYIQFLGPTSGLIADPIAFKDIPYNGDLAANGVGNDWATFIYNRGAIGPESSPFNFSDTGIGSWYWTFNGSASL